MSVAFQKLRTPNVAQVVQERILEEVSEQTRVLGDVLDLSAEKSEYLPFPGHAEVGELHPWGVCSSLPGPGLLS